VAALHPLRSSRRRRRVPAIHWESLSLDIGRLMDRNLASEMWDRYQRGENKAFNQAPLHARRPEGVLTRSPASTAPTATSRATVDRYIGEFERLLDEIARDGPWPARAAQPPDLGDGPGVHAARTCCGSAGVSQQGDRRAQRLRP